MSDPSPLQDATFHLVTNLDEALAFKRWLGTRHEGNTLAFDTETSGLSPYVPGARIRLIQFGDTRDGWAIPWEDWRGLALEALREWRGDLVGHNTVFDVNWIETHSTAKIPRHRLHDTMLQARIVNPLGSGALKPLSDTYIDPRASYGQQLLNQAFKEQGWEWDTVPVDFGTYWQYACIDTVVTAQLDRMFRPKMAPGTSYSPVYEMEMAVSSVLGAMERRGARVDVDYCYKMQRELLDHSEEIREWGVAAHGINMGSMPQLAKRFNDLDVEIRETTPTGMPKIDKWQLQIIADVDNGYCSDARELAARTLDMRQSVKSANTYFRNFADMSIDGIVHPSIHSIGARTARMSISSPALQQCVDGATEVLTPVGWVRFDQLMDGVPIAQYAVDSGSIEFVVPSQVIRQPTVDPLLTLSVYGRTFAYTPDHRVLSFVRDRRRGGVVPHIDTAADWHFAAVAGGFGDRKFARAGHVKGGRRLTHEERATLTLAVIAQADGNLRTDMAKDAYEVSVSKRRKIDALRACGVPLRVTYGRGDRPPRHRGWILQEHVSEWLDDSHEKNFRHSVLTLCEEDLRWFIDQILFWDGDFTRGVSYCQSIRREKSVDVVQAAAALCGYSTSTFFKDDGGGAIQLNLNRREYRAFGSGTLSTGSMIAPDGMVYCATVPSGAIVTRREGLVLITGNCPKGDATVRRAFVPREGNMLVTSDYDQIEARLVAHFSGDSGMITAFEEADRTGLDFFTGIGKSLYTPSFVKSDKRRTLIKNVIYGRIYGAGPAKMAETAGVPVDRIKAVMADLDERFPGLGGFMKSIENIGIRRERTEGEGYIITPLGRRLPCDTGKVYALTNYMVQSTAADMFKQGLLRLDAAGYGDWMLLPVHDEILLDIPKEHALEAVEDVPEILADRNLSVPITADADGPWTSWGERYAV